MNGRDLVLSMLKEIYAGGEFSHILIRQVLEKYDYLDGGEKAFIKRLTEGTLERTIELDYIINQFSNTPVNKMKPLIRSLMRMSVYQILYMDSIPDSAVCNEAVKLAEKKGFRTLKGFVNGVLRNIARNLDSITYPDLSIQYSMPEWILNQWLKEYDKETVEAMLKDFQEDKPTTIRVNLNQTTKEELTASLENEGVHVENHPYLPYALWISGYDYLADLESFQKGAFYVQDISSMLVSHIADPKEGDNVIDVCAAPGGKALHMAELLKGTGHVEARDLTDYKVNLIEENIMRSGVTNMSAVKWDATILDEDKNETADVVIADLPCSGLGVLGKKTDLKYKTSEEIQKSLVQLQRDILKQVQQYVKPDGTLIYSTCTIHAGENMGNVRWFLENFPEFELVSIKDRLCEELKQDVIEEGCMQFLPGKHQSDGFFIAKLRKENE